MRNKVWLLSAVLVLLISNAIYFYITGFTHTDVEWVSYLFVHFAYVIFAVVPNFTPKVNNSIIFAYNRSVITTIYLVIALFAGIVLSLMFDTLTIPLVVQTIIAWIFIILLIFIISTDNTIAKNQVARKADVQFINYLAIEIDLLMHRAANEPLKKATEHLYDAIKSSQIRSDSSVSHLESVLMKNLGDLKLVYGTNDEKTYELMAKIEEIIHKRNLALRYGTED